MDTQALTILLAATVTLFASYIQSVTGFGFGIFAMIFLPSILSYTEANVLSTVLSMLTSLVAVAFVLRRVDLKNLIFPTLGCLVSTYFAVAFISSQSSVVLTVLLGAVLFLLSIYFFFFTDKIRIKPTWYAGLIAGVLSGILGGMFAIGGPPVVVYYMQSEREPDRYMATISAYFVISGAISVVTKATAGFFTATVWLALAAALVAMLLGSLAGKLTRSKINPTLLKRLVYGFMAVSGIVNIVTALL
ncbi:MAG: sulfite exporter TauE/SafE family protein [Clostridia bacterium]|nr:sulfite exporter TauE/SafE family protein [Clostridia bacterium]